MQHVSMTKYEAAEAALSRSRSALRLLKEHQTSLLAPAPAIGGSFAAGLVDAKMGEGSATMVGVVIMGIGWWIGYPTVMTVGAGMCGPAAYRAGRTIGSGAGLAGLGVPNPFQQPAPVQQAA